jgi:hypothetical protein
VFFLKKKKKNKKTKQNIQARCHWHACNPSYSGGRDQEDLDSKPAQANSSGDTILKIPITKRAGGVAQVVGAEFKP